MNLGLIVSLLFCGHIVGLLIRDQYEVFFAYKDWRTQSKTDRVFICFELDDIKFDRSFYGRNESAVSLQRLAVEIMKVFRNLSEDNFVGFKLMDWQATSKYVLGAIETNGYFFHNYNYCIISSIFDGMLISLHALRRQLKYALGKKPHKFTYDYNPDLNVRHQFVKNLGPPYFDCKKYVHPITGEEYSRFRCINDCLVARHRSARYFYPANDSGSVDLTRGPSADQEAPCFDACHTQECTLDFMNSMGTTAPIVSEWEELVSYPRLDRLDFYLRLAMLFCLFLNVSFREAIPALIRQLKLSEVFRKFQVRPICGCSTQVVVSLVSVLLLLACYYEMVACFNRKLQRPQKRWILNFTSEFEPISLFICLPFDWRLANERSQENRDLLNRMLANRTLAELERKTDGLFESHVEQIYLAYHNKTMPVRWSRKATVYFRSIYSVFNRCFHVRIDEVLEPKYQSLLSVSMLRVKCNSPVFEIFLIPEGEEFTSDSYRLQTHRSYRQNTVRRSGNCTDYKQKFKYNRKQLLDKCGLDEFYRHQSAVWANVPINKRYLTEHQWEERVLGFGYKNVDKQLMEAIARCRRQFAVQECSESSFQDNGMKIAQREVLRPINLYYKKEYVYEEDPPSIYEFIFELISIQTIALGINALKLFISAFEAVRFVCRGKREKLSKLFRFYRWLAYVLCFVLFACHSVYFFDGVLNENYVYSQHYEELARVESADHIFCFDYDLSLIDHNHELNGKYLNEVSSEITLGRYFERIEFLENDDRWTVVECNASTPDSAFFSVKLVLFQNLKCFIIEMPLGYEKSQFLYAKEFGVLRVYFNEQFYREKRPLYFISKLRHRVDLSAMLTLDYHEASQSAYTIKQELFEITLNDKLNLIKHPLSLFFEPINWKDVSNYIRTMIVNFRTKYRYQTSDLPLLESDFQLELKNELFEQFYLQVQNVTDQNAPKNYNFERLFVINYIEEKRKSTLAYRNTTRWPDLEFVPLFWKRRLYISSQHSFPTLVLNCLNLLCFWMNVDIISAINQAASKLRLFLTLIYLLLYRCKTTFNPF